MKLTIKLETKHQKFDVWLLFVRDDESDGLPNLGEDADAWSEITYEIDQRLPTDWRITSLTGWDHHPFALFKDDVGSEYLSVKHVEDLPAWKKTLPRDVRAAINAANKVDVTVHITV